MKTKLKICGIRNSATLQAMRTMDVDYVGFVFAPSKRRVSPEEAGEMVRVLRSEGYRTTGAFEAVGVFVNPSWEELAAIMEAAPLDVIQLHGQETPEDCRRVKMTYKGVKVFKAIPIPEGGTGWPAQELIEGLKPYADCVDAFLLDTYDPAVGGGSGRTFSWEVIPDVLRWTRSVGTELFVAGGLHPGNVTELMETYGPDGVDVSSGVESDGIKDLVKIRMFLERVKGK